MASVRKRSWRTRKGEAKTSWWSITSTRAQRQRKTFTLKKSADAFALQAQLEVREGTHVTEADSVTVSTAGEKWIASAEADGLEPTTIDQYRQHLRLHIEPFIGKTKLSKLNVPIVREFGDRLRANGRSRIMVKYVICSLGSLLADAQDRGLIGRNPVHERRKQRRKRKGTQDRRGSSLKVGIDIPTPEEIKRTSQTAIGKDRVFLLVAVFTGLRASELRGLAWKDVNFKKAELTVSQRADRYRKIGEPKTEAAERVIPRPRTSCRHCANGNWPAPLDRLGWSSRTALAGSIPRQPAAPAVPARANCGGRRTQDRGRERRGFGYGEIHGPAFTPVFPSLPGASTARPTAAWSCRRSSCRLGSAIARSRLPWAAYGHLFPRGDDAAELATAANFLLG